MARQKPDAESASLRPPATTLEGRNDQLIAATMDLVERRIADGSASAAETVHFLRQGSYRMQLENEKLKNEVDVLQARVREMESRTSSEELYKRAIAAIRGYQGKDDEDEFDDGHGYY